MWKTFVAGALVLVAIGLLSVPTGSAQASEPRIARESARITEVNISRIKAVLRLTPAQLPYWAPVEAALLRIAGEQAQDESTGLMRRLSHKVVSIALTASAVQRLAASAGPLVRVLDSEQRRAAMALAQEMGLGSMVAALN